MIIHKQTKEFQTRSDKPISNWLNDNNYFIVADNSVLYNKILQLTPRFDFVLDNQGDLIDVIETPKTNKELKQERATAIKQELEELDKTINRATEDLYIFTNTIPYSTIEEATAKKHQLRNELNTLA